MVYGIVKLIKISKDKLNLQNKVIKMNTKIH